MFLVSSTLERNRKTAAEIFETNWKRSVSIFQLADVKHRPQHCLHLSSKVSKRHFHWTRAMIRFPSRVIRDKFHYHLTSIYACRTHQLSILSSRTHTHILGGQKQRARGDHHLSSIEQRRRKTVYSSFTLGEANQLALDFRAVCESDFPTKVTADFVARHHSDPNEIGTRRNMVLAAK